MDQLNSIQTVDYILGMPGVKWSNIKKNLQYQYQ